MIKRMQEGKPLFGDEDVSEYNRELGIIERVVQLPDDEIEDLKKIVKSPKNETIINGRYIEEELI